ncbi:Mate efflux family protein [Seminavis robusta]|uniref:Mate efflux family protein n=1 Tax=Seminavis robusta TaxID=568900 RepID=A0A9N8DW02_9STRA|nr:Mate efflux family protein [Seminavis robusta]|eukprot:Sro386_g131790.1 Mate efflux family protein (464) ;mRNA; r:17-1563
MGGGNEDEGGFSGYMIKTVDLGPILFCVCLLALFVAYGIVLPLLVFLGERRDALQHAHETTEFFSEDSSEDLPRRKKHDDDNDSKKSPNQQQRVLHGNQNADEEASVDSRSSQQSTSTHSSALGSAVAAILDHPPHYKSKTTRRRRRNREREILKAQWTAGESQAFQMKTMGASTPETLALLQAIHPGGITAPAVVPEPEECTVPSVKDATPTTPPPKKYAEDYPTMGAMDKMALISSYDIETKRIVRLSTPFCVQALITGLTDILTVAVVGKLVGTREVSAFVVVTMWVELSSEFVGGLHEALATLCSQAIGARNKELAGSYVQIVVILYTLFFIPFAILWVFYMDAVLRWHGLDEETVRIGTQYTYILVVDLLIDGLGEAIHGLLDVAGFEKYSTLIGATEEILSLVIIFIWALVGNPDLNTVGLIQFGLGVAFLLLNCVIIRWRGWFKAFYKGMFGSVDC